MQLQTWKAWIQTSDFDADIRKAKGYQIDQPIESQDRQRYVSALTVFEEIFGTTDEAVRLFSAPGRTEILGNHTDHQRGQVLAGAVNVDVLAVAAVNAHHTIRFQSAGWPMVQVDLNQLEPCSELFGTTQALVAGVAAAVLRAGGQPKGIDIYATSDVLPGSGLSSSAAIEVLLGIILCRFWQCPHSDPVNWAKMGQFAENTFFGKPSGLMDQMASAVGNCVHIDFKSTEQPVIESLPIDLAAQGYALCILDSGADHADLTEEYAAIPDEMKAVASALGGQVLSDVSSDVFYQQLQAVRQQVSDRAILRAAHYYEENQRVERAVEALKADRFLDFLKVVQASGDSSWTCLQNIYPAGAISHQEMGIALLACRQALAGEGAYRVHGGGFAGTVQAFVPIHKLDQFKRDTEAILGVGACHCLTIRQAGAFEYAEEALHG